MYEIIIHGRGGQGALLAARVLANAYFFEEKYVEAFPYFGGERRGAPVRAFLRVDDKPIRMKTPILSADCAIILDASLLDFVDISILCPKCNEWAIDNANYCHKCGRKLYPCICSKGQEILNKVINNYAESILKRFNILFGGDLIIKKDKK